MNFAFLPLAKAVTKEYVFGILTHLTRPLWWISLSAMVSYLCFFRDKVEPRFFTYWWVCAVVLFVVHLRILRALKGVGASIRIPLTVILLSGGLIYSSITALWITAASVVATDLMIVVIHSANRVLMAILTLGLGAVFFGIRSRWRGVYGGCEIFLGIWIGAFKLSEVTQEAVLGYVTAAVFLTVRGFDNITQAIQIGCDDLVTKLFKKWNFKVEADLQKFREENQVSTQSPSAEERPQPKS